MLDLRDIDQTQGAVAGGKGANLGELSALHGIDVPPGFCVTTDAFRRVMANAPSIDDLLDRLSRVDPDDPDAMRTLSGAIRRAIDATVIPDDLAAAITRAVAGHGEGAAYAVRSSATAEDLPTASFAGQQDTYLNVVGPAAILDHVSRCWASLFTERAVSYRLRNGIDHRQVQMAVVVQRMVAPQAAGVLFTADPLTSNRKVASVEATFGLSEALVSGRVNPDVYTVRDGEVVTRTIAAKARAIHASPSGGTQERAIDPAQQERPALTDAQVVRLVELGRRIEAHFGSPQDIEWCLVADGFQIVQSRPITALFPIPAVDDGAHHVYLSVGHQQMMTDPMTPLGLAVWLLTTPAPMVDAGGRLFVDITQALASPASRAGLLEGIGRSDPLMGDAVRTILERDDQVTAVPDTEEAPGAAPATADRPEPVETDLAIIAELIRANEASVARLKQDISTKTGEALLDFILTDLQELRRLLFDPLSHQVIMAGMEAAWWLNDRLEEWLGETKAADVLSRSVPHNVTAEMGLALLDVADVIRRHPSVVAFLRNVEDDGFLDKLSTVDGGPEARDAIQDYLDRYGMRCVGEIDITRSRWSETPTALVPLILANVTGFEPGAAGRRFEQGRREAATAERDLLARLRALPDGERKATETKAMIDRVRTFAGYREYPKYGMISRYFVYKQSLMAEAERLVEAGVIHQPDDIFFLRFHELQEVVHTQHADDGLIRRRRDEFRSHRALTPPRVLTSDGEAVAGAYRREDLPSGALVGLAVSAGTVEGRARVILDVAEADVEPGDILVTAFTDPSWSPLFVSVAALVTEVGGQMTHGAVIAREYGLPAVVGVEHATQTIEDGQRIRVNGTNGYVEIL
ncbi:MAG: phosphoenolpyruvate synthase [Acidimicrobiales bacterium]|nr:phosphoenolpyruvate synthase [Acidimicrobiales bacterium]